MKRFEFDTEATSASRRLSLWRDVVCDAFVDLDCRSDALEEFRGSVQTTEVAGISLTIVDTCRQHVLRTSSRIARSRHDFVLFAFGLGGTGGVLQDGREALVRPGDVVAYDTSRPFELVFDRDIHQGVLQVPKVLLQGKLDLVQDLTATALTPDLPVQRLTFDFLCGLARGLADVDEDTAAVLLDQAVNLLAVTYEQLVDRGASCGLTSHRAAMIVRLKRHIRLHLRDPDLSLAGTARALGISPRHVSGLMASEKTSFGRFLLAERLERCREAIVRTTTTKPASGEIAFQWGFNDPAHFSRAFRARFGVTPTEVRNERTPSSPRLLAAASDRT